MSNINLFSGVIAPVLTPFDAELSPDTERFVAHAKWLLEDGCTGLAPFGTTGEATSLGVQERHALLDALVAAGIEPSLLLPGTGMCAIPESVQLTRHAVEHGCGGVLMLPPFYYKGMSDDGVFRFFAEVIERVADSRLKVYLYHIPPQAVIGFSLDLVGRLIEAYPNTVVGLKDSSGDWSNTKALLEAFPGFGTLTGSEVFLLDNLKGGGTGCITATGNVNARMIRDLYDKWQSGEADQLQTRITEIRKCIQQKPMIPMLKQIVAHYRDDHAWASVRPPLPGLEATDAASVIDSLKSEHGFELAPERLALSA